MNSRTSLQKHKNGHRLLIDGQPTILLSGELHNSSAAAMVDVRDKFAKLSDLNLNSVILSISWELVEPVEGGFDFSLIDGIIEEARLRRLRLVFLWFGTMKNAISCYVPEWVKTDTTRFFRAEGTPGQGSWTVSPFCREAMECDARAFAAVMRHIREYDSEHGTVIMMQVENESGILRATRDFSPAGEAAFHSQAPTDLTDYLSTHSDDLIPEFADIWKAMGSRTEGTWSEVFGRDADEVFMGWYIASFIEHVTAAGRAEYDIPMFANAWLIAGPGYLPGQYPSGGPVSKLMDVWRAAAPSIDFIAPDIYSPEFREHCASYTQSGNPLFIPEAQNGPLAAANALYAIGRHDAICFSPFAIDDIATDHPLGETYRMLTEMMPLVAGAYGESQLTGFVQQSDEERFSEGLAGYRFNARTNKPLAEVTVPGSCLILSIGNDEFFCIGYNLTITFDSLDQSKNTAAIVWLDEGEFKDANWHPIRRLNGDETFHGTGVQLTDKLTVCKFKLHAHK